MSSETGDVDLEHLLVHAVQHAINEAVHLVQLEHFGLFSPPPASLSLDSPIAAKLEQLTENLGGPPKVLITKIGDPPPEFDFYVDAAVSETTSAFDRARTSICRTYLYFLATKMLDEQPDCVAIEDSETKEVAVSEVVDRFWEHAETSLIRLASFWDRVGQILDFAFFNIRQYERDGFAAVMNRIRANVQPVSEAVAKLPAWERLRKFQNSTAVDGLDWLVRRRNLLIHSLHLAPVPIEKPQNPIFELAYNHLDAAVREKLKPGDRAEELKLLLGQLERAATLFEDAVDLALVAPESLHRPEW